MLLCVVLIFQTLNTFNTVVSPIYYDMFPALTILASAIMFKVGILFEKKPCELTKDTYSIMLVYK
jgi:hypothetical protein